jgi:hypothetical protein
MNDDLEQFLKDTEQSEQPDILNQPLDPNALNEESEEEVDEEGAYEDEYDEAEEAEYRARNRRERRLMQKLEAERESAQFLAAKLEAMTGAKATMEEADYLKGIERIYGTDSPEAQMATELLTKAILGARDDAETRAYERFMESQTSEVRAVQEAEMELDDIIDEIQDVYGVALTEAQEASYFELMQRMSPKDRDGDVVGLADPHAVWEVFSERSTRSSYGNRSKQLASRSLTDSSSPESNLQDDTHQRFLRENGII